MSALDRYHDTVITALTKDGWNITDDPLKLSYGGRNLSVDLGAEQLGHVEPQHNGEWVAIHLETERWFVAPMLQTAIARLWWANLKGGMYFLQVGPPKGVAGGWANQIYQS